MSKEAKIELSNQRISELLAPFGVELSGRQYDQVREYMRILLKWNQLVSLTAIEDPAEIISRHFGESMFLGSLLPVENGRLADVGSGAGFPGLALKILYPNLHTVLIDSNNKKCAFLSELAGALELTGVQIRSSRFEDIPAEVIDASIITARAVGGFNSLLKWSSKSLVPRGHLALWVGGEDTTRISATIGWTWQPAIRIPESQRRFILIGRPRPIGTAGSD